jgi:colicin import membrane protein
MSFKLRHLFAALLLHALLFTVLAGGLQCSKKPVRPPVIRAVLLDPDRKQVEQQRQQEQKRLEEQRRREQEQRRKLEQEQKQREAEQQKQREEEQQRKVAEQERQRKEAEVKKARELAEKKKAEEQARVRREQELQRERQEQAQRELQARAAMEQAMREEMIRREIEQEQQARASTERERQIALWAAALEAHIRKNWVRPPGSADRFECSVRVEMLPDGSVRPGSVRITSPCGSPVLNRSVEDAVYRSSPLPRPADPSVFVRDLNITFKP